MYTRDVEETAVLCICDLLDAVHSIKLAKTNLPIFEALDKGYKGLRQLLSVVETLHSDMVKITRNQLPCPDVHYAMYQSHYEITEAKRMIEMWTQDIEVAGAEVRKAAIKRSFEDEAPF